MDWQYTPYVFPLLFAVITSVGLAIFAWQHRATVGARSLFWLCITVAIWTSFYALEIASSDLAAKFFWIKHQYWGIVAVPMAWVGLAFEYTGREKWLTRRNLALLSVIPAITLWFVWFNDPLIWSRIALDTSGPFLNFAPTYGHWFWVHSAYSYTLLLIGTIYLIQTVTHAPTFFRWQTAVLLVSVLIPWIGNALYIFGQSPLDLAPFAFTLSCLILAVGVLRFHLFAIVPVARQLVVDSMSDGMMVFDKEDRLVDINPAGLSALGHPPASLIGQSVDQIFHDIPDLLAKYSREKDLSTEFDIGENRARRSFDLRISPLYDRHNQFGGRVIVFRDITEGKRAEQTIRENETRLQLLMNQMPVIMWTTDMELRFTSSLGSGLQALGVKPDQVGGKSLFEYFQTEDEDFLPIAAHRQALAGKSQSYEQLWLGKTYQTYVEPLHNADGDIIGALGVSLDITEQKGAETEREELLKRTRTSLKRTELLYRIASALAEIRSLPDLIQTVVDNVAEALSADRVSLFTVDMEKRQTLGFARGGPSAQMVLAIPYEELWQGLSGWVMRELKPALSPKAGLDPRESQLVRHRREETCCGAIIVVPLQYRGQVLGTMTAINRPEERDFEEADVELMVAMANHVAVAIQNAHLHDQVQRHAEGLEQRVALHTQELTAAYKQLETLDGLKSKLIDDISHELRTPITNLGLYLDLFARGSPENQSRYLTVLRAQKNRLRALVEGIIKLSQLHRIQGQASFTAVDLNYVVEQVLLAKGQLTEVAGLHLSFTPQSELPSVFGDPQQLYEVVANLVSNSLNYTAVGEIGISTLWDENGRVGIQVADNGMGIAPEDIPHIFERFYRGKGASQSNIPGTGVGLSIVQAIVDQHGGEIEVESKLGKESTFRVWLPVMDTNS